MVLNSRV